MAFKLGLVGLCTSHPENWVPVIRDMTDNKIVDVEIVAAWDSGETRPSGFATEFCRKFNIPHAPEKYEDMVEMVDGIIFVVDSQAEYMDENLIKKIDERISQKPITKYSNTIDKENKLKLLGYNIVSIWESDFKKINNKLCQ